jgi:hypothetical protein
VLVVDNLGIMGAGVEAFLFGEQSLEVLGIAVESETSLLQEIWRLWPDTIILTVESQITTPPRLLGLLQDYGRLRIILVSANNNLFEVYDRQQHIISDATTFLDRLQA